MHRSLSDAQKEVIVNGVIEVPTQAGDAVINEVRAPASTAHPAASLASAALATTLATAALATAPLTAAVPAARCCVRRRPAAPLSELRPPRSASLCPSLPRSGPPLWARP